MLNKQQAFEGLEKFFRFWIAFMIMGALLVLLAQFGAFPLAQKAKALLVAISEPVMVWLFSAFLIFMSGLSLTIAGPRSSESDGLKGAVFEQLVDAPLQILISLTAAISWMLIPVLLAYILHRNWGPVIVVSWYIAQLIALNMFAMMVVSFTYEEAIARWKNKAFGGRLVGMLCILGAALIFWKLTVSAYG